MATMAQVNAARLAQATIANRAKSAIRALWADVRGAAPEIVRDVFLDAMPQIVATYGEASAEVATEYFESLTGIRAEPSMGAEDEQVQAQVRYRAGKLWTPSPVEFVTGVMGDADRFVKAFGRNTIYDNGDQHGVRYARIPSGRKTCAFCAVLASRDAVYLTYASAGGKGSGNEFHNDCDCEATPVRDLSDMPEGHNTEEYMALYEDARAQAFSDSPEMRKFEASLDPKDKNKDLKKIVFAARNNNPGAFTDGVR